MAQVELDSRFLRRMLAQADNLVAKMVAHAMWERLLHWLGELADPGMERSVQNAVPDVHQTAFHVADHFHEFLFEYTASEFFGVAGDFIQSGMDAGNADLGAAGIQSPLKQVGNVEAGLVALLLSALR